MLAASRTAPAAATAAFVGPVPESPFQERWAPRFVCFSATAGNGAWSPQQQQHDAGIRRASAGSVCSVGTACWFIGAIVAAQTLEGQTLCGLSIGFIGFCKSTHTHTHKDNFESNSFKQNIGLRLFDHGCAWQSKPAVFQSWNQLGHCLGFTEYHVGPSKRSRLYYKEARLDDSRNQTQGSKGSLR